MVNPSTSTTHANTRGGGRRDNSSNSELQAALAMASAATVATPNNTTNAIVFSESTNTIINGTSIHVAVALVPDKKTRGTGYTKVEDLLICKAFISASEDDIVGMSQKGKQFLAKMHSMYMKHLEKQYKMDQMNYQGASSGTRELYGEPAYCRPCSYSTFYFQQIQGYYWTSVHEVPLHQGNS
jgi:hypothetical protein